MIGEREDTFRDPVKDSGELGVKEGKAEECFQKEILKNKTYHFKKQSQISKQDHVGGELRNVCWIWHLGNYC